MEKSRSCKSCGEAFQLTPQHSGFSTLCKDCNEPDVPRKVAKVAWSGKHEVEIEITTNAADAQRFNAAQRRNGAFPIASLVRGEGANASYVARRY